MKNTFEVRGETTAIIVRGRAGAIHEAFVDTSDLPLVALNGLTWRIIKGTKKGALPYVGTHVRARGPQRLVLLHRLILQAAPATQVDLTNGDTFDNRRVNLRLSTPSQNNANRFRLPANTSGYKGVTLHRDTGKWQAQIKLNGRNHYLGLFSDPTDAARAYDARAIELFGEFARTNAGLDRLPA